MPQFVVEETAACWITWRCRITAETPQEAKRLFEEGERGMGEEGPFIGDALDNHEIQLEIDGKPA